MPCQKCGEPATVVESKGGTKEGRFKEKHECVNGHVGYVRGKAEAPAQHWTRTGEVFNG